MLSIKLLLRKRKLWIALLCVFLCGILTAVDLQKQAKSEYRTLYTDTLETQGNIERQIMWLLKDRTSSYAKLLYEKGAELKQAIQNKDWKAVNKGYTEVCLLQAKRVSAMYHVRKYNLYYHDYVTQEDTLSKLSEERGLPNWQNEEIAAVWAHMFLGEDETQMFPYYQFTARFYDQLEKQNIDTLTYSTTDSSTLIVQFIRSLFSILAPILIALLCFDSLHEDRESGVIKPLLSLPCKRIRYLHRKLLQSFASISVILLLPLLVLSLFFGIFDHYSRIQAPVLSNVYGLSSLDIMENTIEETQANHEQIHTLGITRYFS